MKINDFIHVYKRTICRVRTYMNDNKKYILLTELDENQGPSVTNSIEYLIQSLINQGHAELTDTFIEHYPKIQFFSEEFDEVKQYIEELRNDNPKVADIMSNVVYEIELDENKYRGQSILNIIENTKQECIEQVVADFCDTWYASEVKYAASHYRNGEIPNESAIKETAILQATNKLRKKLSQNLNIILK